MNPEAFQSHITWPGDRPNCQEGATSVVAEHQQEGKDEESSEEEEENTDEEGYGEEVENQNDNDDMEDD